MDGLFGVARLSEGHFDAAELGRVVSSVGGARGPILHGPRAVMWASGWARAVQAPDGIHVAGAAHLVNRAELAAAHGTAHPLEIVAALYRAHGVDGFGGLDGQFCLAVLDGNAERVVLATDRFATRLIYYAERPEGLVFGTSLERVAAQVGRAIDRQAILEYLLYTTVPSPRTPFVGISKLSAGCVLVADRSGVQVRPYWDMTYPESSNGNGEDWARKLRMELEAAVGRYARAEESLDRVGAFLSGGTDSSTVAGILGKIRGAPSKTFSIGYHEQGYDELYYARVASRWFGTLQHEWKLAPAEALAALPAIVGYYEEPFGNASALPTYRCAQLAREHGVTVLFAGDGGDELFAGNARYGTDKLFALYHRLPRALREKLLDPMMVALPEGLPMLGKVQRYVRRANIQNPRRLFSYAPMLSEPLGELLEPGFVAAVAAAEILAAAEAHFNRPALGTSDLNRLLYLDLKLAIADNDLRKVSGMTELAGVEVRYPFLDTRLAEFSGQIPPTLKLHGFQKRYIFKQALADFLPPQVLKKTKHGFGAPIGVWMKKDPAWRSFIEDLLHDPRTRQRGYIKPTSLDGFLKQVENDGASFYGDSLWPWLMLELWHRKYDGETAAERDAVSLDRRILRVVQCG
jgi:asparagine synthase (glutamine-hydrolysing)